MTTSTVRRHAAVAQHEACQRRSLAICSAAPRLAAARPGFRALSLARDVLKGGDPCPRRSRAVAGAALSRSPDIIALCCPAAAALETRAPPTVTLRRSAGLRARSSAAHQERARRVRGAPRRGAGAAGAVAAADRRDRAGLRRRPRTTRPPAISTCRRWICRASADRKSTTQATASWSPSASTLAGDRRRPGGLRLRAHRGADRRRRRARDDGAGERRRASRSTSQLGVEEAFHGVLAGKAVLARHRGRVQARGHAPRLRAGGRPRAACGRRSI